MEVRHLDLFSGIGIFSLVGKWVYGPSFKTIAFVEIDQDCHKVLRKNFGEVSIIEDIRSVDGKEFYGVDLLTAGFPCPAFSASGKRGGFEQDNLFFEAVRVANESKPTWIIWENVERFSKWNQTLRDEVENIGYEWCDAVLDARDIGIPQSRRRYIAVCFQRGKLSRTQHIQWVQRERNKGVH